LLFSQASPSLRSFAAGAAVSSDFAESPASPLALDPAAGGLLSGSCIEGLLPVATPAESTDLSTVHAVPNAVRTKTKDQHPKPKL
jgi:hypothetical protein